MKKIAVILSGCGFQDGAEIREAVLTLLALDQSGVRVQCYAPNMEQTSVINHLKNTQQDEKRNVLVESARIARGKVKDLKYLDAKKYNALILPGGYGMAKNLSDLAQKGADAVINIEFRNIVTDFINDKKPIGAICISPAILIATIRHKFKATVTIGNDDDGLIKSLGGIHKICPTDDIIYDDKNKIVSTPAYMRDNAHLKDVFTGIKKLVDKIVKIS